MVCEGLDVTELGAKRLCVRWLDELIVALWHDLQVEGGERVTFMSIQEAPGGLPG